MIGAIWYLTSHQPQFRAQLLTTLTREFDANLPPITSHLPSEYELKSGETWSLNLQGDELLIQAPTLLKKIGPLEPADFEKARDSLIKGCEEWLVRLPGDTKRFPLLIKFRNEP